MKTHEDLLKVQCEILAQVDAEKPLPAVVTTPPAAALVIMAPILPAATPIGARRMRLSKGPERAMPMEQEQVLPDESRSQRFRAGTGTVLRRTRSPKDTQNRKHLVWWEVEIG